MRTSTPVAVRRLDYLPPSWRIPRTRLHFELDPRATRVTCTLALERVAGAAGAPLVLDGTDAGGASGKDATDVAGEEAPGDVEAGGPDAATAEAGARPLALESLHLDGRALEPHEYVRDGRRLVVENVPDRCELVIVTVLDPDANTALEGLYRSSGNYCTQCEAEGFRKITYYLDRPDVLSVFDVSVEAAREDCPVLLSNGNLVAEEDLGGGRHLARWHDPHPKPCYLFALVAGDLASIEDRFVTRSGREVALHVFTEAHNVGRCDFAMASLKAAMVWDEEVYGFEYDLERFTIVAVDDFNMGAMENKGLNVFNTKFVLADTESATDADFLGIESVVAHEYFHNWTGNRITCRDWFQLSLKEGLTVFRDQCFSSDRHSATVKRIEDVRVLRARQFPEDAGPMAHPIRPDSYIEINNFYTLTVYEKGAEVIRMLHTLLGEEGWRRGMALYVERHDGTAATCDDFLDAMETASGVDLGRFRRWYSTAGTPELDVEEHHDAAAARYTLNVRQRLPDTPGQRDKAPLHVPLRMGLLDADGAPLPIASGWPGRPDGAGSVVLDVLEREERFVFEGVPHPPVASLLRGFSAPVRLNQPLDDATLAFLMAHDVDPFNRWEAGQRLAARVIERIEAKASSVARDGDPTAPGGRSGAGDATGAERDGASLGDGLDGTVSNAVETLVEAIGVCLADEALDPAFRAEVLLMPSLDTLAESREKVDVHALERARRAVRRALAARWREPLERLAAAPSRPLDPTDTRAAGERRLGNTALALLGALEPDVHEPLAERRFRAAANMTDRVAALQILCHGHGEARTRALADFHAEWTGNRLVIDKWFAVQAMSHRPEVVDDVTSLRAHPDFSLTNPNRVRALIASFAFSNPVGFHTPDGSGHRLLADHVIRLDRSNPQIAARLVTPLTRWARFVEPQASSMRSELERVRDAGTLSPDVYELVAKSLDGSCDGG